MEENMIMQDITTASADYALVAQAIAYVTEHAAAQPALAEIATGLGVSPFHLQRVFTRWAGVSPKRFLQFLTLEHAKRLLDESRPVLQAAFEAGLSGPGRLHDLFVTVEAVTPGEYRARGAGLEIAYGRHATPFGDCLLAATERGICALSFLDDCQEGEDHGWDAAQAGLAAAWPQATLHEQPDRTQPLAARIFAPQPHDRPGEADRPLALLLKGTNFQLKVWEALLRIPPGSAATYAEVAQALGAPSAARAVGGAVGANAIAYLIPCHRVIRSSGALTGYRWGDTRKRALLGWEAAHAGAA